MKTVEIDIDRTASLKGLEEEFGFKNLQKGDRLQLLFPELNDNELIALSLVIIVLAVVRKRFEDYYDSLLNDIFKNQSIGDVERELKNDYNIELIIDSKEDRERRHWQQYSQTAMVKAYSFDEPEYTENMVKEPNPEYNKK